MRLYGQLTKIEDQADGTLKVFGVASSGVRDEAGEIVTPEAMSAALPDYARYPALREMHQPSAAGRTLEASVDAEGATRIVAQVVDPVAIAKVKSRTYSGFSIGGRVLARDPRDPTVITKIRLTEISLVDRPANPEAVIDLWKADDIAPPAPTPDNAAVKERAAAMARVAGRPGAWKDYVARARAALVAEAASGVGLKKAPRPASQQDDEDAPADETDDAVAGDADAIAPQDEASGAEASDADDDASAPQLGAGGGDAAAAGDDPGDADDAGDGGPDAGDVGASLAILAHADPHTLQAAHDALVALGAVCDSGNCDGMQKALLGDFAGLDDALADVALAKAGPRMAALERRIEAQGAVIEKLSAMPMPPRTAVSGHVRVIGKADDADPGGEGAALSSDEIRKAFDALNPDERAFLLMKASLRQPIPVG